MGGGEGVSPTACGPVPRAVTYRWHARRDLWTILTLLFGFLLGGCASAPHQVVQLHDKECELIQELRRTHLAMVDAYVDERLKSFEDFYFKHYGPVFRRNWETAFKEQSGRPYDADRDFPQMYNDMVAAYQQEVEPLASLKVELRERIMTTYDQALQAHQTVAGWILSVERLNTSQRDAANTLLGAIQPGLSLDAIDTKVVDIQKNLEKKLQQ